jgi:signal transduction histidine kinase/DNA-binding response OmpR family regulator
MHTLMVEDTQHDYLIAKRTLEKSDPACKITRVSRGEEALERLQTEAFDIILLDFRLPGISGLETFQQIVAQNLDIPVVFITGSGNEPLAVEALKLGAQDYLVKDPTGEYLRLLPTVMRKAYNHWENDQARKQAEAQRDATLAALRESEVKLRQRNRELILLNRTGQKLSATLNPEQIVGRLLPAATEIIGAEGASIWLWDEEQQDALICQALFHNGQTHSPPKLRLRPGLGIAGWVVQTGEGVFVPRVSEDPRFFPDIDKQTGLSTTSLLAVPLWVRGKVIGVLEVANKQRGDFDADDLTLVKTLAASAAIALDNAQLVEMQRQYTAELQARNEELDAFAHTAAHDLKGPLGHMVGFAETLEEHHAALPAEELCRHLNTIAQSGRKMSNIVDELLLLSSVRKLKQVNLGPVDMMRVVVEAQERLIDLIETHRAKITLPQHWPTALGYAPWIEEIWVNYLSNAIKYGGRPPRVELGADTDHPPLIRFWVRDNGPGLTPEEQERLFTPFTRLDQVRAKGHGLGLSIARRIAEKLGGQVQVQSTPGHGSTFSFSLPKYLERG